MKTKLMLLTAALGLTTVSIQAQIISEFYGNQPGSDPSTQTIELFGTPSDSFTDWWLISVESDSGAATGLVDRASSFSGTFDANGLFTVDVSDLENPSFSLFLTNGFTGTVGSTDIDVPDDGSTDFSTFGTIFDAVGVIEDSGDPDYVTGAGGAYLTPFASGDPDLVFRAGSTGDWYYTQDGTSIVYDENANVISDTLFTADPFTPTFGSFNPSVIPEPSVAALALIGLAFLIHRFRRK